jgi:hypothetical protein
MDKVHIHSKIEKLGDILFWMLAKLLWLPPKNEIFDGTSDLSIDILGVPMRKIEAYFSWGIALDVYQLFTLFQ